MTDSRRKSPLAEHRFNNDLRYRESDDPGQWHLTPSHVLAHVIQDLGGQIDLDPCTFEDNPTDALNFYTAEDDGLTLPWWGQDFWLKPSVFVNPPYGKAREPWVRRCIEVGRRGQKIILLVPAATDTRSFQQAAVTSTALVVRVCSLAVRNASRESSAARRIAPIGADRLEHRT